MIAEIYPANSVLWSCFWQSTACLAAGLAVSFLLRRSAARAHRIVLLAILAAVLVPPASIVVKRLGLGLFEGKAPAIQPQPRPVANTIELKTAETTPVENFDNEPAMVGRPAPTGLPRRQPVIIPWNRIIFCTWIAATVILAARLVAAFLLGVRILRKASPLRRSQIRRALRVAAERLTVADHVDIFTAPGVRSPVIWCWRKNPTLLLPRDAVESEKQIDWLSVVCHELAHFKRRDHVAGLFGELAVCLLPWNPLIWLAKKRLVRLSEQACDDWVLDAGRPGPDYAESLLDLLPQRQLAFVSAVVSGKKGLASRVRRILRNRRPNPRTGLLWGMLVTLIAVSVALTVAFAQTRPAKPTAPESPTKKAELTTMPESTANLAQRKTEPSGAAEKTVLQGRVTGPGNEPIRNVTIQIRERGKPGQLSIAAPDLSPDEQGHYRYGQIAWPYEVGAIWRENVPDGGYRHQYKRLNKTFEESQTIDFHFDTFPAGTSSLIGTAVEPNGQTLTEFTIDIRRKVDWKDHSDDHLYQFGLRKPLTAADGAFEIHDLPADTYQLSILPTRRDALELRDFIRIRTYEFILAEGRALQLGQQHGLEKTYFGRVLFDSGRPAVPDPPALKTHVVKWERGYPEGQTIAIVEKDGYFTACISDEDMKLLKSGQGWLTLDISEPSWWFKVQKDRFPVELLSRRRQEAGSATIASPSARYGRILFEDGRPAVPDPLPWPGAKAYVILRYTEATSHDGGITEHVSNIDKEGYFTAYLPGALTERAKAGEVKLEVYFPSYLDRNSSYPIGRFPARLLSADKAKAGVFRIKPPEGMPAPAVSPPGSLTLLKEDYANAQGKTQIVRIDIILAASEPDARLDAGIIREIEDVLATKFARTNLPGSSCELLCRCAQDKRIAPEKFQTAIDMLVSREYLKILMEPTLEVLDGRTAKISSTYQLPITTSADHSADKEQTYGKSIAVKPQVYPDGKTILFDIQYDLRMPKNKASDAPRGETELPGFLQIDGMSTLDALDGHYVALPVCDGAETKDTRLAGGSLLLMLKPTIIAPQQDAPKPQASEKLDRANTKLPEAALPEADAIVLHIVDSDGRAVVGAAAGTNLDIQDTDANGLRLNWLQSSGLSDQSGTLTFNRSQLFPNRSTPQRPAALYILHEGRRLAGVCEIPYEDTPRQIRVGLEPACNIHGQLASAALDRMERPLVSSVVFCSWQDHRLVSHYSRNQDFQLSLPAGAYELTTYGFGAQNGQLAAPATRTEFKNININVNPGQSELDLGSIDLPLDRLASLTGKPAPDLTAIKGWKNGNAARIADFRGKWVLLEFWGYWCGPCLRQMPEIMRLHDAFGDRGLVVIGVHNDTAESIEDLDSKLANARAKYWGERDLPFLVALDGGGKTPIEGTDSFANGATTAAYGVTSFPTTLLVDPDGKVAGLLSLHMAKETLEEMLGVKAAVPAWRKPFDRVYRLEDGQILKRIAPPFIPERKKYYLDEESGQAMSIPYPPDRFVFHWDGMLVKWGYGFTDKLDLDATLRKVLGLRSYEYEGPAELMRLPMPGDWIIRDQAQQEAKLKAFERLIADELGRSVRFERRTVTKEVLIATGTYRFHPPSGTYDSKGIHLFADQLDGDGRAGGGTAESVNDFLERLGSLINMPVINRTQPAGPISIPYRHHKSAYLRKLTDPAEKAEKLPMLLRTLTRQSELQFEVASRPVELWLVAETPAGN